MTKRLGSDRIYEEIEIIGSYGSRSKKEELIKANSSYEDFYELLKLAYDPFVRFGIAKLPKIIGSGEGEFTEDTLTLLGNLAKRKLTGNAANNALLDELERLTPASQELLKRIITKDMRAGFTSNTLNKVIKGWVPVFSCMLAHKFEERIIKRWPVAAEPKLDGVRVLALVNGSGVQFVSRTGKEFTSFDHMKEVVETAVNDFLASRAKEGFDWSGVVLDGEMVSGNFNETVSSVRKKDVAATDATFHLFELLPMDLFAGDGEDERDYVERRLLLEEFVNAAGDERIVAVPRYLMSSVEEILKVYEGVRARGLEGLIIKDLKHRYECKRSRGWLKIKNEESEDLIVTGAFEGEGKYVGMLGGLIVKREHNGETVEVRVGGGFSDQQRVEFWEAYQNDKQREEDGMDGIPVDSFELLNRMIEVEYHELTPDGSLRHPRFIRFRDDKHQDAAA